MKSISGPSVKLSSSNSLGSLKVNSASINPNPASKNPPAASGNLVKNPSKTGTKIAEKIGDMITEKIGDKGSKNRDVLSNITNNRKSSVNGEKSKKNVSKSSKKGSKSTKRSSEVLDHGIKSKNENKNKKRKSDPMVLDDEEITKLIPHEGPMEKSKMWEDIDQNDTDDPQAVAEYANEIYEYLMEKEKDAVDPSYITSQVDINEKMRSILIDWLIEVHRMFKLLPETLFLTVSIIDRYLSLNCISRDKLQLVGVTSMLISSKYEEIYAPECNDFVYISDGAYTKQQILKMEQTILNSLNFNITHPSALHFLRRYSKAASSDYTLHTLCKYLIEIVLLDLKFLNFRPSMIAAASVYLGRAMMGKQPYWTPTLEHYSTYDQIKVRECAVEINDFLIKSQKSSLKAVKKKYSLPKFSQVADIPLVEL